MKKFTSGDRVLAPARIQSTNEDGLANVILTTETGSRRCVTVSAATMRDGDFTPVGFVWDAPTDVMVEGVVIHGNIIASEVRFEDGSVVTVLNESLSRLSFVVLVG